MYLTSFVIERVKCFELGEFHFPKRNDGRYAGWHVLLGANATGKTTALRAMAVSLMGPNGWRAFEPVGWVPQRWKNKGGALRATIAKGEGDVADRAQRGPFHADIHVVSEEGDEDGYEGPQFVLEGRADTLKKSVYAPKKAGWFCCGYGPFRRLTGGSAEAVVGLSHPRQLRVASLFRESVALLTCEEWLKDLDHRANDGSNGARGFDKMNLEAVVDLINSMLPEPVQLTRVSSAGARFESASGEPVALAELSDGFRSFLAFAIDIVRHLADAHEGDGLWKAVRTKKVTEDGRTREVATLAVEGVVFIDEVDAHLHPSWQRRIGPMLQRVFPNVQFIVSTHSPFVAQSASHGGLFVLSAGRGGAVSVVQPVASVRGWRADALLTSKLFGLSDTVDLDTERRVAEYHTLSSKRSFAGLTAEEQARLDALETELSHTLISPGETVADFERRRRAGDYVDGVIQRLEAEEARETGT
jgi:hypothetical protein